MVHAVCDLLDGGIDVFFGRETTEGEAEAGVCQVISQTEGHQYVARLKTGGGTGGAGAQGDVLVEGHHQPLTFNVLEADVGNVGHAVLLAAVDVRLFEYFHQTSL